MIEKLDLGLFSRRSVRHVRQTEIAECGLACLTMIARYHGGHVDLRALRQLHAPSMRGASLKGLIAIADQIGLACRPVKLPLEALRELQTPAVLHWDMSHYVVYAGMRRGKALVFDPAAAVGRRMPMSEVSHHFTGVAVEVRRATGFSPTVQTDRLRLWQLWSHLSGWKRAAAHTLSLTVVLQAYTLASPYYMQLAIDSVVPSLDLSLLTVLALGFGLFTVFNAGASLLRSMVIVSSGTSLGFGLAVNLAHRLFRLPVVWFERRHVGDILSRFQALQPIQDALSQGLVGTIVDGVLSVFTLALMFWYSTRLALVALAAFAIYALIRAALIGFEREAREVSIVTASREQSTLIETIRGIITLRLCNGEAERHVLWQSKRADAANAAVGAARFTIWQQACNTLVFGLENIITVWLAIRLVISGGFSIGMVVGYLAYKQQFIARSASLLDQAINFRMLGLYLDRLSDIALSDEDLAFGMTSSDNKRFSGQLSVSGLNYRYSQTEPLVLKDVTFQIAAGSHVAITGVSGSGKSTLAKILLGLVEPSGGTVSVDGVPLHQFGYHQYRSQIAAVLQDDSLFSGSIADNIAMFDEDADHHAIAEAACLAAIDTEIMQMPMRFDTLVGDMGSTLSGGQKARVLLARALYRKPRLLLLDEGTAHLDLPTERRINNLIKGMGITRIVIAHRAETIHAADRVLALIEGRLVEQQGNDAGC